MTKQIDVRDLPEEDVRLVERLVEFLRHRSQTKRTDQKEREKVQEIQLAEHPSNVIGEPSRTKIYEHLK